MSKGKRAPFPSEELSAEEVAESYEYAAKNGLVTDTMGNKIDTENDMVEYDTTEPKVFSFNDVLPSFQYLQGRVLTIIDASIPDADSRNKFIKDLVKDAFVQHADKILTLSVAFLKASKKK